MWYRSRDQHGAPQPGDIVVAQDGLGCEWTGRLRLPWVRPWVWVVEHLEGGEAEGLGAQAVRYPTESELAAYHLDPVTAGTARIV